MIEPLNSRHGPPAEWPFPFRHRDWEQTPPAVQTYLLSLHQRLDQLHSQLDRLQERLDKTSQTSHKPPSSDSPFQTPKAKRGKSLGKRGGRPGHPGTGPQLLSPTEGQSMYPEPWACGQGAVISTVPSHTHQVIELPPIDMHITHVVFHQGTCAGCGHLRKATLPSPQSTGYGPRLTALVGELSAMHRRSRRLVQDFCGSVLQIPISLGTIQTLIDRTSQAIVPHSHAIAALARTAPVGSMDETLWYCRNTLPWLWTMGTDTVSLSLMHPHRSKEAVAALIDDWSGILVSDG